MTAVGRMTMLVAATGCALALGGCGAGGLAARVGCLPSRLHVDPSRVRVGGIVTVSSGPFACRGSYHAGHHYTLVLGQVGRAAPVSLGVFPVSRDGAFRAVVQVPPSASPGESYLIVRGSPFDHCADTTGAATSCAGYDARVAILPRT